MPKRDLPFCHTSVVTGGNDQKPTFAVTLKSVLLFVCLCFLQGGRVFFVAVSVFNEKVKKYQRGQQLSLCKSATYMALVKYGITLASS